MGTFIAATFDTEQQDLTMQAIEAMYSDGSPVSLNSIINRSITKTDGSNKELSGAIAPTVGWKVPGTSDMLTFNSRLSYKNDKEERWRDYTVNYGADPVPADRRRQYFDNTPNHTLTHSDQLQYHTQLGNVHTMLGYEYTFTDQVKDSYMYALDRLEDMGIYGTLPAGWLDTFDPRNSYTSRLIENTHQLTTEMTYDRASKDQKVRYGFFLMPSFALKHTHFDYARAGRDQSLIRTDFLLRMSSSWACRWFVNFGRIGEGRNLRYRNVLVYQLDVTPKTPDPVDMVDVVNDADPLNIYTGNVLLSAQYRLNIQPRKH